MSEQEMQEVLTKQLERRKVLERIQQYIDKAPRKELMKNYDMNMAELGAIGGLNWWDGIYLAFQYGRAKGYKAALKLKGAVK